MRLVVAAFVVLLVVLHQDTWFWNDTGLVGGIVPVGLAWHAGISLAAGLTWWLAAVFCWPHELDEAPTDATRGEGRP